jgi:DNA helicase-2/ATP-dependent DNA helicase PcrA
MFALEELNADQRQAVDHGDGPLLVVAGAGTGKTATLAARLGRLIADGATPERTCLLTFSRRAAAEMMRRAGDLAGRDAAARVVGGTFHSVAQRLLHHHGPLIGLDPGFSVLDAADAVELMGLVRTDLGLGQRPSRFPRRETLAAILSHLANAQESLTDVVARSFPWCGDDLDGIRQAFSAYTARKRERQLCDFDDLLLLAPLIGEPLATLFDYVLVDEYQDVNALQANLVEALRPTGQGLTAVGDDAQAIYGFRAASAGAMLAFEDRFPGATVIRLEHNYRSTPAILAVANQVMAEADDGCAKRLWSSRAGRRRPRLRTCLDEGAQAEAVCRSVLDHREEGVALHRQAVLFRAGHHADRLELALARRHIPYVKYGGIRHLEAAHVRDLLALLRVLDNPADDLAWFRVLQLLEGVGPVTARKMHAALSAPDPGSPTPLAGLLAAAPAAPPPAVDELNGLRVALGDCLQPHLAAGPRVDRLGTWLKPVVARRYDAPAARCADLDRLAEEAAMATSIRQFVADLALDPPVSSSDRAGQPSLDDDWLVLSTVHSAKGGEWDVVHVIHASDGMFPSDLATGDAAGIAEERRLFYVALTRARDALEISVPMRYHHHRERLDDRHSYGQMSRFLSPAVRALMDASDPVGGAPPDGSSALVRVDAALAALWN